MNGVVWTKKKAVTALVLCAIIAVSSFMVLQTNNNAQAAIIDPHPGLVGWWNFNEGSGTVAADSSGNSNDGTLYGVPSWVTGKYGEALRFNGLDNRVFLGSPSSLKLTDDFSVSAWINLNSLVNYEGIINWNAISSWGFWVHGNGQLGFCVLGNSNYYSTGTVSTGTWTLVTVTIAGGKVNFYINGQFSSQSSITPVSGSFGSLNIGGDSAILNIFDGTIDDIRVYNRALSAAEIQTDFNGGPDFSTNVLAKVPQGTTQVITTLSWQGTGDINVEIISPSQTYTEDILSEYQKSTYSTSEGVTSLLNIKRLSASFTALPSDQNWHIMLTLDKVDTYQITVEVQK